MKIALCSDWYYPKIGGIATHIKGLAKYLSKLGHEVKIITIKNFEENYEDEDGNVIRLNASTIPGIQVLSPLNLKQIKRVILGEKFDVVHGHHAFTPVSLYSISLASKYGFPTVLTAHSLGVGYQYGIVWKTLKPVLYPVKRAFDKANKIIAVSEAVKQFMSHIVSQPEKIEVIPNGVDLEQFICISNGRKLREELNLPLDDPIVFFVGRFSVRKGIHILMDAFKHVVKEIPDAKLLIAGKGFLKEYLKHKAKANKIAENVKFLGCIFGETLAKFYMTSDVVVCPSIFAEAFGIVILEAMAAGKPVIATNVGGIPEIVDHEVNGLIVEPHDVKELSNAIIRLLSNDKERQRMGKNAKKKVEERYDWRKLVFDILRVYEEIQELQVQV
ncbi:MAG: glycosyltransferase family 4 protein [Candidatus Baldrarchaeia archaeon]